MKVKNIFILALSILAMSCGSQLSTEEYITNGKNYVAKENWDSAIIEYRNAIKQSSKNPEARWLLAQVYLKVFNSRGALKELNKSVDLGYSKQKLLLDFARAYKQLGQFDEILAEINPSGITDNEIKASLLALRSEAYLRKSHSRNARSELDKAIEIDDQNTDVRLAASKYEGSKRNYKKQREWLQPLLDDSRAVADAWSELAVSEQREGNLDKAEEYFSKSIAIRKVVHIDHMKRAYLRIAQEKYKLATADISALKKAGIVWPMVGHGEGLIAYEKQQFDQAKTLFEQVLSNFPAYTPSQLFLGLTQYNKGNYQSAIKILESYLASHPKVLQARMVYAISLVEVGRLKEGTQKLERLNNDTPGNARIMSLLGSAYLSNKETEKGIWLLRKVVLIEKNAAAHLQLGMALISSGRKDYFEEGKQELKTARKLNPELTEVDSAMFRVHISEKDYDSARKIAKKVTTTQNDSPLGYNLEALTYLAERDEEKATIKLQETLKQFPADTLTSNNLGRIYLGQNNLQGAKELYQAVLKKVPGDLTSLNQMALISAKEGRADDVISWLSEAVEKNPDQFSAKLRLANQYLRQSKGGEALNVLLNVKRERKQLPSYLLVQAKVKMAVKEYDLAVKILNSLLLKQPKATSAHLMLAQIYGLQKEPAKMRRSLESAIALNPNHLPAYLVLARLDLLERKVDDFQERVARLILMYPQNKDVQFLKARLDSSNKDFEGAIDTLSSILDTSPQSEVVIDLARNYWSWGDKAAAISSLELWLQEQGDNEKVLMVLAKYYLTESRQSEAMNTYQRIDSLLPNNATVLNNLAWLMLDTDVAQGLVYAEKALKLKPDNPLILDTLAILKLKNGDSIGALLAAEKAAKAMPRMLAIQINYAKILSANNQNETARTLLNNQLNSYRLNAAQKRMVSELLKKL